MNVQHRPHLRELVRQLDQASPQADPERLGWRILLATAWAGLLPGSVDDLVELAISGSGRPRDDVDRGLVEGVALDFLAALDSVAPTWSGPQPQATRPVPDDGSPAPVPS